MMAAEYRCRVAESSKYTGSPRSTSRPRQVPWVTAVRSPETMKCGRPGYSLPRPVSTRWTSAAISFSFTPSRTMPTPAAMP